MPLTLGCSGDRALLVARQLWQPALPIHAGPLAHGSPQGREAEREANNFASAFLMPRASVLAHAPRLTTIDHLIKLKKYWGVSAAALTYRLHAVGVLSDWHY